MLRIEILSRLKEDKEVKPFELLFYFLFDKFINNSKGFTSLSSFNLLRISILSIFSS
jgi:hypothetical protein